MKTPYLLGIITALLFGSFTVSGMMAQGGVEDIDIMIVPGNVAQSISGVGDISTAVCPVTHMVIGGNVQTTIFDNQGGNLGTSILPVVDSANNQYTASIFIQDGNVLQAKAFATCAKINFPMMGMVGGELLDIDTMALFIGAIGVNPVITGLVAISMGGVAAQAIWYVNNKRKSRNSLE